MKLLATLCVAAIFAATPLAGAQYSHHKMKTKPEPTAPELAEYIRGQLLAYSPDDGYNDNQQVSFDAANQVMTVQQPDGRCEVYFGNLDANTIVWDIFDASDSNDTRERLLRVTIIGLSGKAARTCYNKQNQPASSIPDNRARLLFAQYKTSQTPGFAEDMTKALQALIKLDGGLPAQKLF
jgi:hypothetical protein